VVVFKPGDGERVVSVARLGETGEEAANGGNGETPQGGSDAVDSGEPA
jgi:hypothetical protein